MSRYEYYKDRYLMAIAQKERIIQAVYFMFGYLTFLAGSILYLLSGVLEKFADSSCGLLTVLTWVGLLVAICSFFIASKFYVNASYLWSYYYLSYPKIDEQHRKDLIDYDEGSADKNWENFIIEQFIICTTENEKTDELRRSVLQDSQRWIIRVTVVLAVTAIPYFIHPKKQTLDISIVDPIQTQVTMSKNEPKPTKPKPVAPKPRIVQEGFASKPDAPKPDASKPATKAPKTKD